MSYYDYDDDLDFLDDYDFEDFSPKKKKKGKKQDEQGSADAQRTVETDSDGQASDAREDGLSEEEKEQG